MDYKCKKNEKPMLQVLVSPAKREEHKIDETAHNRVAPLLHFGIVQHLIIVIIMISVIMIMIIIVRIIVIVRYSCLFCCCTEWRI